ncbi:uncharacterized protein LOC144103987 [Amblyomma americanum]
MPSEFTQYVLVGFCVELDWRPLTFRKPIPEFRVCGACGLVRKKTAILSCMHVLCENCYDQSARDEARVCPIDGNRSEERDVELREVDSAELLDREVKCWNEESGCGAVLPACKIAQHFQTECRHHTLSCRKCSATLLCSDVYAHLRSECCTSATPVSSEHEWDSTRNEQAALPTSATETSERCTDETKAVPDVMFAHSSVQVHTVSDLSKTVEKCNETLRQELQRGINSVKETMRRAVDHVTREQRAQRARLDAITAFSEETRDGMISSNDRMMRLEIIGNDLVKEAKGQSEVINHISEGVEEVKGEVKESKEKIDRVGKMLRSSNVHESSCEFSIKGVGSLREKAQRDGFAVYRADCVYLLGYCTLPGVYLQNKSGTITLHPRIQLRMGDMDDAVQWPFTKTVKLRVMHPVRREDREIRETISPNVSGSERPHENSTAAVYTDSYFKLDELISEGFAEGDELRVEFQLQK